MLFLLPLISKDLTSQQYPQELLPSLYIVEHQQLQALHKEFCQQLVGTRYLGQSVCQCSYPQQMYDISHDARGKENLISRVKNSPSVMKVTSKNLAMALYPPSPFSPSSIPPTLLVNSLVTVHTTLLSSSIPQTTPSSFNMLAELEAIQHKRDEAAQQNEAPVAGSVEGQSVPVKIKTLVGKVV
ncbi:hypothetical protein EMCRGX_G000679 [Ephydatia muelleri]